MVNESGVSDCVFIPETSAYSARGSWERSLGFRFQQLFSLGFSNPGPSKEGRVAKIFRPSDVNLTSNDSWCLLECFL